MDDTVTNVVLRFVSLVHVCAVTGRISAELGLLIKLELLCLDNNRLQGASQAHISTLFSATVANLNPPIRMEEGVSLDARGTW